MLYDMQKNIRKLARPFRDGDWPNLGCPCGEGGLGVGLFEWENQAGAKDYDDDPTDPRGHFYLRLVCGRVLCTSWVIVTGDYTTDWELSSNNYLDVWPTLTVRTIVPPIPVIDLTDDVPKLHETLPKCLAGPLARRRNDAIRVHGLPPRRWACIRDRYLEFAPMNFPAESCAQPLQLLLFLGQLPLQG